MSPLIKMIKVYPRHKSVSGDFHQHLLLDANEIAFKNIEIILTCSIIHFTFIPLKLRELV